VNGYRARVEQHRRRLAEAALSGERAAVPRFNWVVATIEGVTDAARVPRRRKRPPGGGATDGQVGPTDPDE
jgi:hypothetical protein